MPFRLADVLQTNLYQSPFLSAFSITASDVPSWAHSAINQLRYLARFWPVQAASGCCADNAIKDAPYRVSGRVVKTAIYVNQTS